jgi:hypothetical protein
MKIISWLMGAAALCVSAAATAQQSPQSQPAPAAGQQRSDSPPEQKQMTGMVLPKMHMTNQMEVKLGELAMKKGAMLGSFFWEHVLYGVGLSFTPLLTRSFKRSPQPAA